jgi:hypothetical protein
MHLGEFLGDRNRMSNIRFAGFSGLTRMGRRAELVGCRNFGELIFGEVRLERFDKPPHAVVALIRARQF